MRLRAASSSDLAALTLRCKRVTAILVAFIACSIATGAAQAVPPALSLVDHAAPAFALADLKGKPLRLRSFRGKVVLLNFWATWCAPCQVEMPAFANWQSQYGSQGLQVIGISMDDDSAPARQLVDRLKLNYLVAMGNEHLGARYGGVLGLPLTFLIDRNGIVRARFQGETNLGTIERRLESLLSQQ